MIPAVYRATFSYLLRHPWQLGLAVLGIAVGVAVIVAVDLANASARKAFLLSMDAVTGEATHQVIGGPRGVDERVYVRLRSAHGIREIAPVVEGTVYVDGAALQLLGVDLFAEFEMRSFTHRVRDDDTDRNSLFRLLLTQPGAVTMSAATAASLGLAEGATFEALAAGQARKGQLIATFADDNGMDNLLVTDIATAQAWLDQIGWLTRIDVRIDDGDAVLLNRVRAALPPGNELLSAAGRTRNTADLSAAFMTNLRAMSLLALLVGLFLIYNSVSFSVLQRRGLIGVLRAIGFTRRQMFAMVVVEAAAIGLLAAGLGVLLGIRLGEELLLLVSRSINDLYFRVSVTDVSLGFASIAKGVLAGVGAAVVAAAVPAIEAMSYPPRLALARSALERRTGQLLPAVALAGLGTMFVALLVLLLSGRNLVAGLTAVFLLILGFALLVPLAVRAASWRLAPIAKQLGGTPARMAAAGIAQSLSRTGIATVALAIAVAATIGVSVMVDSFRGSVSDWLEQTLQADVYVCVQRGSLDPALIADIAGLAGVADISSSRRAQLEDEAGRTQLVAIKMAPGSYAGIEILDAEPAEVWPAWQNGDVVLVSEPYSYMNGVRPGESIALRTAAGARDFAVLATYQSYDINASAVLMSRTTYDRHFVDDGVDSIGLYLTDGADDNAMIAQVEMLSAGRQQVLVNSNARIRELSLEIFDRTFVITDVLYWLAVGVAFIGILGAMLALQLERARELAVLRALGMTPVQLGSMMTLQTAAIGLLSGLAALPLGIVMAYVLIEVINRRAFGWQIDMAIAPGTLLASVSFAVLAALLAGLYPAYRAARSRPAMAMREE